MRERCNGCGPRTALKTFAKSTEITAIPELLKKMELIGADLFDRGRTMRRAQRVIDTHIFT